MALKWVFLDLDNTLWDFDGNAEEALRVLFERHKLDYHTNYKVEQFIALYKDVNHAYWSRYEKGEVNKETLRTRRFTDTFELMGLPHALYPENVWQEYLDISPLMTKLVPNALKCLEMLASRFKIGILTNGFQETQTIKLRESGLGKFVDFMQSSEAVGVAKPSPEFFKIALQSVNCLPESSVYIGDNFNTDVMGGLESGIKTYWYQYLESSEIDDRMIFDKYNENYGGKVSDLCHWATSLCEFENI